MKYSTPVQVKVFGGMRELIVGGWLFTLESPQCPESWDIYKYPEGTTPEDVMSNEGFFRWGRLRYRNARMRIYNEANDDENFGLFHEQPCDESTLLTLRLNIAVNLIEDHISGDQK